MRWRSKQTDTAVLMAPVGKSEVLENDALLTIVDQIS